MKKYLISMLSALLAFALPTLSNGQDANTDESRAVAVQLMQQLAAELKKELSINGPVAAMAVCQQIALENAQKISIAKGWRVTRISLKTRNPLLGTPDAWEQSSLMDFDRRAAAGEALDKLERAEIVTEPAGRYFRYLKALPVQPLCLSCHGGAEQIADEVKAALKEKYPHDQAIGYSAGQVRGAISIKRLAR